MIVLNFISEGVIKIEGCEIEMSRRIFGPEK
jgi:hypothetical protein